MLAGQYNFIIEQGARFLRTIAWRDTAGNPVPLTGYSARMMLRRCYGDPEPLLSLTTFMQEGLSINNTDGTITIDVPAEQTAKLDFLLAKYDLEIVDPAGHVTRLLEGNVTLSREATWTSNS